MAHKVCVSIVDDLDGIDATQTVTFGLDGIEYSIDLSDKNAGDLRDRLSRYRTQARRVGGRQRKIPGNTRTGTGESTAEKRQRAQAIRSWARKNGWPDIADRGRVSSEVATAYEKRDGVRPAKTPAKKTAARKPVAAAAKARTSSRRTAAK